MSINFLKSAAVILCGGVFGFSVVQMLKPEAKNRSIASAPLSKLGHQRNGRSLFDVKVDLHGLAKNDSDVSTLKVSVEALKPAGNGLTFKWNLPAEVQIVSGTLTDSLPAFSAGEKREFSIQVKGFSKQLKKFASFEIEGLLNNYKINREVLISSRIEDSLEYLIQQNELKKENTINKTGQKNKSKFDPKNIVR
jgi:hypothetical protein